MILGIETSCDETGVALLDSDAGCSAQALHSQVDMHAAYGGVVPELASRDHVRRVLPLPDQALAQAGRTLDDSTRVAVYRGPGSRRRAAGRRQRRAGHRLALGSPVVAAPPPRRPPAVAAAGQPAARVSFRRAAGVWRPHSADARRRRRAATRCSERRSTTPPAKLSTRPRKLLGLGYPGGPAVSRLADFGVAGARQAAAPDDCAAPT